MKGRIFKHLYTYEVCNKGETFFKICDVNITNKTKLDVGKIIFSSKISSDIISRLLEKIHYPLFSLGLA